MEHLIPTDHYLLLNLQSNYSRSEHAAGVRVCLDDNDKNTD